MSLWLPCVFNNSNNLCLAITPWLKQQTCFLFSVHSRGGRAGLVDLATGGLCNVLTEIVLPTFTFRQEKSISPAQIRENGGHTLLALLGIGSRLNQ